MYFPAIIAYIIAISVDEILKVVVPHAAIKYLFNFILLVTIKNDQWWRGVMTLVWNGVWEHYRQLDD
jgi:hypothetical protein